MAKLRDSQSDFRAIVDRTAEALKMPQAFIEKDYWVTELLRGAAQPVENGYVVFKGGTSLSKAYRLVKRFSEDVDVLLVVTREKGPDFGAGSIDGILKKVTAAAGAVLGLEAEPTHSITKGVKRYTMFPYEAFYASDAVKANVKLELGTRGGDKPPSAMHQIRSYIAEASNDVGPETFEEFRPVGVRVLAPERTLLEKLSLVHDLASRYPATEMGLRLSGRHFYDIVCLLRNEDVISALAALDVAALCRDIHEIAVAEFSTDRVARPENGFAASGAFDARAACARAIWAAYGDIDSLLLEEKPSLEEVLEEVGRHSHLL